MVLLLLLFVVFSTLLVCGEKQREGVGGPKKENVGFCLDVCHSKKSCGTIQKPTSKKTRAHNPMD